jgi:hypothetical protein
VKKKQLGLEDFYREEKQKKSSVRRTVGPLTAEATASATIVGPDRIAALHAQKHFFSLSLG